MGSIESHMSTDQILAAVERLSLPELKQLVEQVIAIKAARSAPHLPTAESTLLARINQGLPGELNNRLKDLQAKRDSANMSETELAELTLLTDQVEEFQAARIEALAELARLRGVTLTGLMEQLGICFPDYV